MSLCVVDKVKIHNFQINFYLTTCRQHIRLTKAHSRAIGCVLPYVNQGPWVESEGKKERAVKITFDEFLRPAIEAWKAGLPYAELIYGLPQSEIELIAAGKKLTHVHADLSVCERGYSSESDLEVDVENDEYEFHQDDKMLTFFGYPYLPAI